MVMTLIYSKILKLALEKRTKIGVGVGNPSTVERVVSGARQAFSEGTADVVLIGRPEVKSMVEGLPFYPSEEPEKALLKLLISGEVDGAVRGSLSASTFLKDVKEFFGVQKVLRVALLENATGHQFMFAPVGIDEGEGVEEKVSLATGAASFLEKMGLKPRIAILSGGRIGDLGRSLRVDRTIKEAEEAVSQLRERGYDAEHCQILIEDAVADRRNVIIAPEGISGNLIYRTLIHLGLGKSYGAVYLNTSKPIVDTSRAAPPNEYAGAITMAAVAKILQKI